MNHTSTLSPARRAALVAGALGLALAVTPVAEAAPAKATANTAVKVTVTVKGPTSTLFNGSVTTKGHSVTTATGGTHKCDGTNNEANTSAGPTPTAALDDAAKKQGFTWDGTWYPSFDDYFVTTIGGHNGGNAYYWNIAVNGEATQVGGCQLHIKAGDKVAFTWTKVNPAR
ncbi:hypothetical protein C9F11_35910 [Streptomyces sp. YIM 121038]|uniref:DUF4430 domain-containing protein n=1 Tax=Streptomyces sp. YIM 121038 TaxID=2136401 RepID=UPI0011105384|nr:DUF4430 domain-containing protein [Streptomyces sp. YIM 121038]QCX80765.1 hypothetical protein C9F11_35910 [Streptomyces sp. YIM 121038]